MAIPNDRIIEYSNSAVSKESFLAESGSETRYNLDSTVGKILSGTGTVSITEDQGLNSWTSMYDEGFDTATWSEMTVDTWVHEDSFWGITTEDISISSTAVSLRTDEAAIKFLYVKNTGENQVKLALEGDEYDILIPAGASVSMRVNDSVVTDSANIKVIRDSADSTIEYIIAK